MKYRKKPVVVEAIQYRGKRDDNLLKKFINDNDILFRNGNDTKWFIDTPEGYHGISENDYIIKGVKGEFYPCKPDIFEMTYEPVDHGNNDDKKIVMTVKEAETIEHIIAIFQHYYILFGAEMTVWQELRKRIEEAEKKND